MRDKKNIIEPDRFGVYHILNKYGEMEFFAVPYRHYKNFIQWIVCLGNPARQEHINVVALTSHEAVRLAVEYSDKYLKFEPFLPGILNKITNDNETLIDEKDLYDRDTLL